MKPAIYYAFALGHGVPGFGRLMAVTSVKGSQVYGRDVEHGNPTHRSVLDVDHSFATEEAARGAVLAAAAVHDRYAAAVHDAEQRLGQLQRQRNMEMRAAVKALELSADEVIALVKAAQPTMGAGTESRLRFRGDKAAEMRAEGAESCRS